MFRSSLIFAAVGSAVLLAQQPAPEQSDVVFRSEVSLARIDAQVVGRGERMITGLGKDDFVLLVNGEPQPIANFGAENVAADVLLLLDVSGSMRSHIERLASAAGQALSVLGPEDRVAIMVFDRSARVRMPFRDSRADVERGLQSVIHEEGFNNGTDIPRALREAANYVQKNARRDARRAIVILTDDQTERTANPADIDRALADANAVLSLLLAPDATGGMSRRGGGGSWPRSGGGGTLGGPLGGIIFGRRGPYGGGNGPVILGGPNLQSAGTAAIARRSGGDSMSIDDAEALENTLARIRQRYALHYYMPDSANGAPRVEVRLSAAASRMHPGAEIRHRQTRISGEGSVDSRETVTITESRPTEERVMRRRPAVDEPSGQGGWRRVGAPEVEKPPTPVTPPQPAEEVVVKRRPAVDEPSGQGGWRRVGAPDDTPSGGWRRIKPGEQP